MAEKWNVVDEWRCFGGRQLIVKHYSKVLGCDMKFSVYLPPQAKMEPCPIIYWLSGLTCTEQNFITKAGAQRYASECGVIVVAPDTSPRGEEIADDDGWDLGQGAGFYVNATQSPWNANYRMYDYVVDELPGLVEPHVVFSGRRSIMGHSMGGHGALIVALKNPERYRAVSAFSPIVAPCQVPWGQKAFGAYLGDDRDAWREWDACELVKAGNGKKMSTPILVDQGDRDGFLDEQLRPSLLQIACDEAECPLELRYHPGYDHSYYFIATFIGEHFAHHVPALYG